jgi:hypothetical protein
MTKYTISIQATYELKGKLLKHYLEWLNDHKDSESMRQCFLLDQFAPMEWHSVRGLNKSLRESTVGKIIDPRAKLTIKENN